MRLSRLNKNNNRMIKVVEAAKYFLVKKYVLNEGANEEDKYFQNIELIEWLKSHGIKFNGVPPSKRGSQGIVYFFGDKVLKISRDSKEIEIAKIMKGDAIVAVVDLMNLGDAYGILQHAVNFDKNHPVVKGLDILMAYFDNKKDQGTSAETVIDQQEEELVANIQDDHIIKTMFAKDLKKADLLTAVRMIKYVKNKSGHTHDDAASSNVGLHHGKPVFTDLGPNVIA